MKITIQHYDETASLEVPDGAPLEDFRDALIRILHVMWLPQQVAEIMRVHDWGEGYTAGLEKAMEEDNDVVPRTINDLTEIVQKAGYYTDSEQKEAQ